jgi:small subunit ribosomal protein S17
MPPEKKKPKADAPATAPASMPSAESEDRKFRKTRTGLVVSAKMVKTVVVRVDRLVDHSFYPRTIRASIKLKVHDPASEAKLGDWVRVMETRPMSKTKRWRLVEVIRRGSAAPAVPPTGMESAGLEELGAARKSVKSTKRVEGASAS